MMTKSAASRRPWWAPRQWLLLGLATDPATTKLKEAELGYGRTDPAAAELKQHGVPVVPMDFNTYSQVSC
ncbi:hypothetical protein EJB05_36930 [Eragrostis curvula]|uniref:Uncharacterized protein n=1 Tax=Eragrostis curvula TaxID=38414 RepID=A0A5J9TZV5_9POAL|nr:hypothetical protein EJB05_36930 [Eragrostis curvula]